MLELFDTTLRDGSQREGITFSLTDKLSIARKLDDLGIAYIEGGFPGSNPKDIDFFRRARDIAWQNATIVAFGGTRYKDVACEHDPNMQALRAAAAHTTCLVGKSSQFHVREVLETSLEENLRMIADSIRYLLQTSKELIFDAEHFFDGAKLNKDYALQTLCTAAEAGASCVVLCDTNGGSLPDEVATFTKLARAQLPAHVRLGIHTHNDSDLGTANTIAGVQSGATHVQGTINGYGERCGNANLSVIIPTLQLKLGMPCLPSEKLAQLMDVSRFVAEVANLAHDTHMGYVGESAFAHKAGYHSSGMMKNAMSYQHIDPALVGNQQRILVSEQAGRSGILYKATQYGVDLSSDTAQARAIVERIKVMEARGFQFEVAEASLELLIRRTQPDYVSPFELLDFTVTVERRHDLPIFSEATVKVRVQDEVRHTAGDGNGPVNALDAAMRKALGEFYPGLVIVRLVDYKVRILDGIAGTAASTRVLIESTDGEKTWTTVGGGPNIIEASWFALADGYEYALMHHSAHVTRA
jgi:2-isopropylmalate synthase